MIPRAKGLIKDVGWSGENLVKLILQNYTGDNEKRSYLKDIHGLDNCINDQAGNLIIGSMQR